MCESVAADIGYGLGTIPSGKSEESEMDSEMLVLTVWHKGPR